MVNGVMLLEQKFVKS